MNSLHSISHLRKKGTKGKSVLIFLPYKLFTAFFNEDQIKERMKRLYNMPGRGLNFTVITPVEIKIIDSLFYQWQKYRNTLGMAKYTNQLLEWFFIQLFQNVDDDIQKINITDVQQKDLEKLCRILEESVTEERIEMESISKKFQTPYSELEELFEALYSKTVFEYFKTKKIEYAFSQLMNTEKSIGDIAFEIGYANPSNFSVAFKKMYNVNPQDIRVKKI
jgi:AraC-like DNA-binding protein